MLQYLKLTFTGLTNDSKANYVKKNWREKYL